jgi:hypothetical protein
MNGDADLIRKIHTRFLMMDINSNGTFEHYIGDTAENARLFLKQNTINESGYFVMVHTPEGSWGLDHQGLFLESLLPFQKDEALAECQGQITGVPSLISLGLASKGLTDNYVIEVRCGKCSALWLDGIRYKDRTVVRCPACRAYNLVDSSEQ